MTKGSWKYNPATEKFEEVTKIETPTSKKLEDEIKKIQDETDPPIGQYL